MMGASEHLLMESRKGRSRRRNADEAEDFPTLHSLSAHSKLLMQSLVAGALRLVAPPGMRCQARAACGSGLGV